MEASTELRYIVEGIYRDFPAGVLADWTSSSPDVVAIGSDPEEFLLGGPEVQAVLRMQLSEAPVTEVASRGPLLAFAEGNVGWVIDNVIVTLADGNVIQLRSTFVFHRERGGWKIIHFHNSAGIPNREAWGLELTTSVEAVEHAVIERRPDLSPLASRDGTVTIVFTDIESSTTLNQALGDERWHEVLREHITAVERVTAEHRGETVERAGDGFMLAFASATSAIRCAIGLQRELQENRHPMRIRIGVHTGEPIREDDAFFGRDVAYAARVAACASGGEILASSVVRELARGAKDIHFAGARQAELKGFEGMHMVHPVELSAS